MMNQTFLNTLPLTKFILKRDRIRLILWVLLLTVFCVGLVPVFQDIILKGADMTITVEMMKNPAIIAMVGPVYGETNYTVGAAYGNYMLVFSVMIAAVMNIFLITRHTRHDEELGRLEVIRSLPVGRLSNLASAMNAALFVNLLLSILTTLGLYAVRGEGMSLLGCAVFGFSMGIVGLVFAGITAFFCQLTANNRTAMGLSFLSLFVFYILRAIGDTGVEALSMVSPLGIVLRTENFVNDYLWPLILLVVIAVGMFGISFYLAHKRDLGQGLIAEKPGKKHASKLLSSPMGLALRLSRTFIIVWGLTLFSFAAMYGSVFGDLEGYIGGSEVLSQIFNTQEGTATLTEQFIVLLIAIMSLITTVPLVSFVNRIVSQERDGVTEHILSKAVSRTSQVMAYLVPTLIIGIVYQLISAYGFWVVGSQVLDTVPSLGTFVIASLAYLPAIWCFVGIALLLIGYLPERSFLSYVYLGYAFLSIYFGRLAAFPEWTRQLTPFGFIAQYPLQEITLTPLVVLTVVSILFIIVGIYGYRNRDMVTQ